MRWHRQVDKPTNQKRGRLITAIAIGLLGFFVSLISRPGRNTRQKAGCSRYPERETAENDLPRHVPVIMQSVFDPKSSRLEVPVTPGI